MLIKFSTSEGSGSICLHFLVLLLPWISSIGEVRLSLHAFVVWLCSILRSFGITVQELDEPRRLAYLVRKSTIDGVKEV
jgi:hypothetical protein